MSEIRAGSLSAWILAMRLRTLPVSVGPVLVGSAVASSIGHFRIGPAVAACAGALLLQIGSNFANDVFDFEKGADTADRLGPPRATQMGLLGATELKRGMVLVFALAAMIGLYLAAVAGPPIVAIGVVSIAAAIAYTGGPWPLGYHGLGDVAVFLFFGPVAVVGTTFVLVRATGGVGMDSLPSLAWIASIPIGALAAGILVVNNLRDIETDRRAGKRTLAVRLGRRGARLEWVGLVMVAYLSTVVAWLGWEASPWVLLPWSTLPQAVAIGRVVRTEMSGPALNEALAATARLGVLFAALFALGLCL